MSEPAEQGLDRVWTGSLCQGAMSPALSFCHQFTTAGPLKTHLVSFDTTNMTNTADPNSELKLDRGWKYE